MQGRDIIGTAYTGSGKTAAFALPILQRLAKDPYGVYALVMTPTRELAYQISDQFRALGAGMSLRQAVVIGGLDMQQQARELAKRPHIVIATPGRLADLIKVRCNLCAISRTVGSASNHAPHSGDDIYRCCPAIPSCFDPLHCLHQFLLCR